MSSATTRPYLTIAGAAGLLEVHPKTIRRYIAQGRLTAYRLGNHLVRLHADEVDALLRPIPNALTGRSPAA